MPDRDHHQGPRDRRRAVLTLIPNGRSRPPGPGGPHAGPPPGPSPIRCTAARGVRHSPPQTGEHHGHLTHFRSYRQPRHPPQRCRRSGTTARARRAPPRPGDKIFLGLSRGSGILLLVIMAAIAVVPHLPRRRSPSPRTRPTSSPPSTGTRQADPPVFGIAVLAFGTVVSSIIAMVIAVPVAVGIALFISHYAPRKLAAPLAYVIDLLAAVPSHHLRPLGRALPRPVPRRPQPLAGRVPRLDRASST